MLFGFTYSRTVGTFPQAMFIVGAAAVALAFLCTLLVRLPKDGAEELVVVAKDGAIDDEERVRLFPVDEEEAR